MKPIPGGVTKVTHANAKYQAEWPTKSVGSKPVREGAGFDLSGDATNCIKGTGPFGEGKRNGLFGKRTVSRNQ